MSGDEQDHETGSLLARAAAALHHSRRRLATAAVIVLACFFAWHVITGRNGISVYQQKRDEDRALKKQIQDLQQENSRLKEHVNRLQSDPDTIEHEARATLHYARPGEVIYTLNGKSARQSAPEAQGR